MIALGGALVGAVEMVLFAQNAFAPLWVLDVFPGAGVVYLTAGLVAWWRRPGNHLGMIIVFGGWSWFIVALANLDVPALIATGLALATLPLAVAVHILMAFPSGRLRSRLSRWTVACGYVVALVLQIPLYLFSSHASPQGILAVANLPALASAGKWFQHGAGAVVFAMAFVVLGGRLRRSRPGQRTTLGPLYLYGMVSVLFTPLVPAWIGPLLGFSSDTMVTLQVAALIGVPVAFAGAMLLGGFSRTSEIEELGAWLGAAAAARPSLNVALGRALGDPSVQLAYWIPDREVFVDGEGSSVEVPGEGSGRGHVEIELDGRRVAAVIFDSVLIADAELVRAAARVVAIALDQDRLTAELRASREALRLSRARLVEAGDRERRRIAQDLHDGLQMKFVLLGLEAQRLACLPETSPVVAESAIGLRCRIDQAAAELRRVVHEVMPAPLIERGLGAATRDLADRMPVPTRLDIRLERAIPEPVSSAAYFVVAEALTNAVKHARAQSFAVRLAQDGDALSIEVRDDGVGGAGRGKGLGLRSLADRVEALGGRLRVDSPEGAGTLIVAELPCGS